MAWKCGGITLFVFGGVAEMADEPPNAGSEFWVAIAGPIAGADAVQALGRMNRGHLGRLIVVDDCNHLAVILALSDLLGFLSLKVELEGA